MQQRQPDRQQPPRASSYIALSLLIGMGLCGLAYKGWRSYSLSPVQSRLLVLYGEVSLPFSKTISRKTYDQAFGVKEIRPSKAKLLKAPIRQWLQYRIYEGKPASRLFLALAILSGSFLFVSLVVGVSLFGIALRRARNWQHLRGPNWKTVKEFNRTTKGDCFELTVTN